MSEYSLSFENVHHWRFNKIYIPKYIAVRQRRQGQLLPFFSTTISSVCMRIKYILLLSKKRAITIYEYYVRGPV